MTEDRRFGLAEVELKAAFRQEGCPICRVQQEAAARYLFHLLWENVNDLSTRVRLVHSGGFCPAHTWQLYRLETEQFGDGVGNGIIYEDLAQRVSAALRDLIARLSSTPRSTRRRKAPPGSLPPGLAAGAPCPVCVLGNETARRAIGWLVAGCADGVFRAAYAASSGLCLAHLREALQEAESANPEVAVYLADDAAARLDALQQDLGEYVRKGAWQYRHEQRTAAEGRAPERAVRFFGGLDSGVAQKERRAGAPGHTAETPADNEAGDEHDERPEPGRSPRSKIDV